VIGSDDTKVFRISLEPDKIVDRFECGLNDAVVVSDIRELRIENLVHLGAGRGVCVDLYEHVRDSYLFRPGQDPVPESKIESRAWLEGLEPVDRELQTSTCDKPPLSCHPYDKRSRSSRAEHRVTTSRFLSCCKLKRRV